MKPTVLTRCVANSYAGPNERIIEFVDRDTGRGGLISFFRRADGTLSVSVYRCDDGISVSGPAFTASPGHRLTKS